MWKKGSGIGTDRSQILCGHRDGIAGREKEGAYAGAIGFLRPLQVFLDFPDWPYPKGWPLLVDHTKGTLIMRAAHGRLCQQAIRFTRGPINGTFITHISLNPNLLFYP